MAPVAEKTKPQIAFKPRRLAHANIFVSDVEKSVAFYNAVCGLEVVLRQPEIKAGFLSNGNTHHDIGMLQVTETEVIGEAGHRILSPGQGARPSLYHLGWEMENEQALVEAYERTQAAGLKIWRTVRHRASHSVYLFDPDGNIHEFYADVAVDWRRLYAEETSLSGTWKPGENTPSIDAKYDSGAEIRAVDGAPVHPLRMSHAVMTVRNAALMHDFFVDVAGLAEAGRSADGAAITYASPASRYHFVIATVPQDAGSRPRDKGLHHFAFEMASPAEVDRAEKALSASGVGIERSISSSRKRSIFIRDPDRMLVEFCCVTGPAGAALSGDAFEL